MSEESLKQTQQGIGILFEPGALVEVRGKKLNGTMRSGFYVDHGKMARALDRNSEKLYQALWYTLQKLKPGAGGQNTGRDDIDRMEWLVIDIDRVKPKNPNGTAVKLNATDEELAMLKDAALRVKAWLASKGWPGPVVACSGNGWHLLYKLNHLLPTEYPLLYDTLRSIGHNFRDEASLWRVDPSLSEPEQLIKAYGTRTCLTPESHPEFSARPWRQSYIDSTPGDIIAVPHAKLEEIAAFAPPMEKKGGGTGDGPPLHENFDEEAWWEHWGDVFAPADTHNGWQVTSICPLTYEGEGTGNRHSQSVFTGVRFDRGQAEFSCFSGDPFGGGTHDATSFGEMTTHLNKHHAPFLGKIWDHPPETGQALQAEIVPAGVDIGLGPSEDVGPAPARKPKPRPGEEERTCGGCGAAYMSNVLSPSEECAGCVMGGDEKAPVLKGPREALPGETVRVGPDGGQYVEEGGKQVPVAAPEAAKPKPKRPKLSTMPEECMDGWLGEFARGLGAPLGHAYTSALCAFAGQAIITAQPGNVRGQLYGCLIAPKGEGKSRTMDRCIDSLEWANSRQVVRKYPGSEHGLVLALGGGRKKKKQGMAVRLREQREGWVAPEAKLGKAFATEEEAREALKKAGFTVSGEEEEEEEDQTPRPWLLALDEMKWLMAKAAITNSALPFALNQLFYKDELAASVKGTDSMCFPRLSILGGLTAANPEEFAEVFGKNTESGTHDRFIFSVAERGWDWDDEWEPSPVARHPKGPVHIPHEIFQMRKEWAAANPAGRGRLGEIALRVAVVATSANQPPADFLGRIVVTPDSMRKALLYCEWQEAVRGRYRSSEMDEADRDGKCQEAVIRAFQRFKPDGGWADWRELCNRANLYRHTASRLGRTRAAMVAAGMLVEGADLEEGKEGKQTRKKNGLVRLADDLGGVL